MVSKEVSYPLRLQAQPACDLIDEVGVESDDFAAVVVLLERGPRDVRTNREDAALSDRLRLEAPVVASRGISVVVSARRHQKGKRGKDHKEFAYSHNP